MNAFGLPMYIYALIRNSVWCEQKLGGCRHSCESLLGTVCARLEFWLLARYF